MIVALHYLPPIGTLDKVVEPGGSRLDSTYFILEDIFINSKCMYCGILVSGEIVM